jgi:HEAT repeat protein
MIRMTGTIGLGLFVIGLPLGAAAQSVGTVPPARPTPAKQAPQPKPVPPPLLPPEPLPALDFHLPDLPALDAVSDHLADLDFHLVDTFAWAHDFDWPDLTSGEFQFAQAFGGAHAGQGGDRGEYSSGLSHLNRRNYEQAIARFDRAIAQKGSHTDGALYWKAFAQYKLGRTDEALATLAELRRSHAKSRYLADAKVLETEARGMSGRTLTAEQIANMDDDEIKLIAIDGIRRSNPEGAIPLLEGLLNAASSLPVKRRALYVLALSDQPRARQILLGYAKGAGNPELQMEAIRYVAANREHPSASSDLRQIYESSDDPAMRLAVINAYRSAGHKSGLLSIASATSEPLTVRRQAVSGLTGIATPQDLWALYQKEPNSELRAAIVSAFGSMGAVEQLNQVIRTEKDPAVRQRAIRVLGSRRSEDTGQALVDLYGRETDTATRKAVISALAQQNNAEGLIAIARKEGSLELKKEIVGRLSSMASKSKVAADYLLEIIK